MIALIESYLVKFESIAVGLVFIVAYIVCGGLVLGPCQVCMRGSRGGRGSGPPLKNHKNIGFLINTCLDPLKITKLPSQHSMLGHHRHAS